MSAAVATTVDALHTHLLALSTLGPLEEYSLGAIQGLAVSQIRKAISELGKTEAYSISRPLISMIVDIAQRDGIALADEIIEIATDMPKLTDADCHAFVMSVDIRGSTELMLKARTPEQFASFTTALCKDLMGIIVSSYGVFDKFTGDGILGFFPDFFSDPDAAYRVVDAAAKCHQAFEKHYLNFRRSFKAILVDTGLGSIGIDCGHVRIVNIADGLTVVGEPVVYACRLSGAPAKTTLLNQAAYELVNRNCGALCEFRETELSLKNQERLLTYAVQLAPERARVPAPPEWLTASRSAD